VSVTCCECVSDEGGYDKTLYCRRYLARWRNIYFSHIYQARVYIYSHINVLKPSEGS